MPLALVALGAMAVGTGLQIAGNAKAQSAMNAVRANSVAQQRKLQAESDAYYQKSASASTKSVADQQMASGAASRQNAWDALQTASQPIASALPATGDATGKAQNRANTAASTWNTLNAQSAARQGSYGDWETAQATKNAEANQKIGMINNFSRGDAALLPVQMQVASQAGDKLSGWGNIVQTLGSLAFMANSAGAFAGGTGVSASQSANVAAEMAGQGMPGMTGSASSMNSLGGVSGGYDDIPLNTYTG